MPEFPISRSIALTVILVAAPGLALAQRDRRERAIAITGVTVIDVAAGERLPDRTVLVRGDRIVDVGPTRRLRVPADAVRVDGGGKFLIPGLWDAHTHVAERRATAFPLLLANGVTAVRDLHFGTMHSTVRGVALRDSVNSGLVVGPRFLTGTNVAAPGFMDSTGVFAATPDEGRAVVRDLHAKRADFVKVYGGLSLPTYLAILDEAKKLGLPVDGHVSNYVGARVASDAGQRTIEHVAESGVLSGCTQADSALRADVLRARATPAGAARGTLVLGLIRRMSESYDETACRELARRLARNGTAFTPTLLNDRLGYARFDAPPLREADRPYVPSAMRGWYEGAVAAAKQRPQQEEWRAHVRRERAIVRLMQDEGVTILAGTDFGTEGFPPPGISLHEELGMLVDAGLTPPQALRAATINPARAFRMTDSLGTVARGKLADVVLLDADPLLDIGNARRINGVLARGRWMSRATLDSMLADIRTKIAAER